MMFLRPIHLILLLILITPSAHAGGSIMSPEQAHRAIKDGTLTLIDVRSPAEWRRTGLAKGAVPITMHNKKGMNAFLREILNHLKGDQSKPIAMICATGVRSHFIRQFLALNGFSNVSEVPVGMLGRTNEPGWIAQGLPVEPCPNC